MTLAVAVVGHMTRAREASTLAASLAPATVFFDDGSLGTFGNHARALAWGAGAGSSHLVVLEDDAAPIPGFIGHAERAATERPDDLIGLYVGRRRPFPREVGRAVDAADRVGASWLLAGSLLWAVGYIVPTVRLPSMLAAATDDNRPRTDERLGAAWVATTGRPVVYTWPSLVDHVDELPSVCDEHPQPFPGRVARRVGVPTWSNVVAPIYTPQKTLI